MFYLKSFYRKKIFLTYLILEVIVILSLFVLLALNDNVKFKIDILKNYYINRELSFISEDSLEIIQKNIESIESIELVYKDIVPLNAFIDGNEYKILPYIKEKKIFGNINQIKDDNILLPLSSFKNMNKNDNLNIIVDNKQINLNVIGIYDDMDKSKIIYISSNLFKMLSLGEYNTEKYIVIVDKNENINNTIEELNKFNYHSNVFNITLQDEISNLELIKKICLLMIFIVTILDLYLQKSIICELLENEKKDIAILKALGYRNYKINLINLLKLIIVLLLSFLIVLVLFIIIKLLLYSVFRLKIILLFNVLIIVSIILVISNFLSYKKLKNINPIYILKG